MALETKGNTNIAGLNQPNVNTDKSSVNVQSNNNPEPIDIKLNLNKISEYNKAYQGSTDETNYKQSFYEDKDDVYHRFADDKDYKISNYATSDLDARFKEMQSAWDVATGTAKRFLTGTAAGLIDSAAGLVDFIISPINVPLSWMGEGIGYKPALSFLTDWTKEFREEVDKNNHIFMDGSEGYFDNFSMLKWADQLANQGYTSGIILESMAEQAALSYLTGITGGATAELQAVNAAKNISKIKKAVNAVKSFNAVGKAAKFIAKPAMFGVMQGIKETYQNSYEVQENVYNKLIASGMDEETARKEAIKTAGKNMALEVIPVAAMNALQWGLFNKAWTGGKNALRLNPFAKSATNSFSYGSSDLIESMFDGLLNKIGNRYMKGAVGLTVNAFAESIEEGWQQGTSNYLEYLTLKKHGALTKFDGVKNYTFSESFKDSMIGGAFGGALMSGFGKISRKVHDAVYKDDIERRKARAEERLNKIGKTYKELSDIFNNEENQEYTEEDKKHKMSNVNKLNVITAMNLDYEEQNTKGFDAYQKMLKSMKEAIANNDEAKIKELNIPSELKVEDIEALEKEAIQLRDSLIDEYNNTEDDYQLAVEQLQRKEGIPSLERAIERNEGLLNEALNKTEKYNDQEINYNSLNDDEKRAVELQQEQLAIAIDQSRDILREIMSDKTHNENIENGIKKINLSRDANGEEAMSQEEEEKFRDDYFDNIRKSAKLTFTEDRTKRIEELNNQLKELSDKGVDLKKTSLFQETSVLPLRKYIESLKQERQKMIDDYKRLSNRDEQRKWRNERIKEAEELRKAREKAIRENKNLTESEKEGLLSKSKQGALSFSKKVKALFNFRKKKDQGVTPEDSPATQPNTNTNTNNNNDNNQEDGSENSNDDDEKAKGKLKSKNKKIIDAVYDNPAIPNTALPLYSAFLESDMENGQLLDKEYIDAYQMITGNKPKFSLSNKTKNMAEYASAINDYLNELNKNSNDKVYSLAFDKTDSILRPDDKSNFIIETKYPNGTVFRIAISDFIIDGRTNQIEGIVIYSSDELGNKLEDRAMIEEEYISLAREVLFNQYGVKADMLFVVRDYEVVTNANGSQFQSSKPNVQKINYMPAENRSILKTPPVDLSGESRKRDEEFNNAGRHFNEELTPDELTDLSKEEFANYLLDLSEVADEEAKKLMPFLVKALDELIYSSNTKYPIDIVPYIKMLKMPNGDYIFVVQVDKNNVPLSRYESSKNEDRIADGIQFLRLKRNVSQNGVTYTNEYASNEDEERMKKAIDLINVLSNNNHLYTDPELTALVSSLLSDAIGVDNVSKEVLEQTLIGINDAISEFGQGILDYIHFKVYTNGYINIGVYFTDKNKQGLFKRVEGNSPESKTNNYIALNIVDSRKNEFISNKKGYSSISNKIARALQRSIKRDTLNEQKQEEKKDDESANVTEMKDLLKKTLDELMENGSLKVDSMEVLEVKAWYNIIRRTYESNLFSVYIYDDIKTNMTFNLADKTKEMSLSLIDENGNNIKIEKAVEITAKYNFDKKLLNLSISYRTENGELARVIHNAEITEMEIKDIPSPKINPNDDGNNNSKKDDAPIDEEALYNMINNLVNSETSLDQSNDTLSSISLFSEAKPVMDNEASDSEMTELEKEIDSLMFKARLIYEELVDDKNPSWRDILKYLVETSNKHKTLFSSVEALDGIIKVYNDTRRKKGKNDFINEPVESLYDYIHGIKDEEDSEDPFDMIKKALKKAKGKNQKELQGERNRSRIEQNNTTPKTKPENRARPDEREETTVVNGINSLFVNSNTNEHIGDNQDLKDSFDEVRKNVIEVRSKGLLSGTVNIVPIDINSDVSGYPDSIRKYIKALREEGVTVFRRLENANGSHDYSYKKVKYEDLTEQEKIDYMPMAIFSTRYKNKHIGWINTPTSVLKDRTYLFGMSDERISSHMETISDNRGDIIRAYNETMKISKGNAIISIKGDFNPTQTVKNKTHSVRSATEGYKGSRTLAELEEETGADVHLVVIYPSDERNGYNNDVFEIKTPGVGESEIARRGSDLYVVNPSQLFYGYHPGILTYDATGEKRAIFRLVRQRLSPEDAKISTMMILQSFALDISKRMNGTLKPDDIASSYSKVGRWLQSFFFIPEEPLDLGYPSSNEIEGFKHRFFRPAIDDTDMLKMYYELRSNTDETGIEKSKFNVYSLLDVYLDLTNHYKELNPGLNDDEIRTEHVLPELLKIVKDIVDEQIYVLDTAKYSNDDSYFPKFDYDLEIVRTFDSNLRYKDEIKKRFTTDAIFDTIEDEDGYKRLTTTPTPAIQIKNLRLVTINEHGRHFFRDIEHKKADRPEDNDDPINGGFVEDNRTPEDSSTFTNNGKKGGNIEDQNTKNDEEKNEDDKPQEDNNQDDDWNQNTPSLTASELADEFNYLLYSASFPIDLDITKTSNEDLIRMEAYYNGIKEMKSDTKIPPAAHNAIMEYLLNQININKKSSDISNEEVKKSSIKSLVFMLNSFDKKINEAKRKLANSRKSLSNEEITKLEFMVKILDDINSNMRRGLSVGENDNVSITEDSSIGMIFKDATNLLKRVSSGVIDLTDENAELLDDDDATMDTYSFDDLQENVTKNMLTAEVRALLSGVQSVSFDGELEYTYLGLPKYLSYSEAFNVVERILTYPSEVASNRELIIKRLREHQDMFPFLGGIIENLNGSEKDKYFNALEYAMSKNYNEPRTILEKDGRYSVIAANANNTFYNKRVRFERAAENFLLLSEKNRESTVMLYESAVRNINNLLNSKNALDEKTGTINPNIDKETYYSIVNNMQKLFGLIGLDLNKDTVEYIVRYGFKDINSTGSEETTTSKTYTISELFLSNKKGGSLFLRTINEMISTIKIGKNNISKNKEFNALINKLINLDSLVATKGYSKTFRDSGKTISSHTNPRWANDGLNKLKYNKIYRESLLNTPYSKGSLWLNYINNVDDNAQFMEISPYSVSAITSNSGKSFQETVEFERLLSSMTVYTDEKVQTIKDSRLLKELGLKPNSKSKIHFMLRRMNYPAMSDKKQMFMQTAPALDLLKTVNEYIKAGMSEEDAIKDAISFLFSQTVNPEIERMLDYYQRPELYDGYNNKNAFRMFSMFPMLNFIAVAIDKNGNLETFPTLLSLSRDKSLNNVDIKNAIENLKKAFQSLILDELNERSSDDNVLYNLIQDKFLDKFRNRITALGTSYINQDSIDTVSRLSMLEYIMNEKMFMANLHQTSIGDVAFYADDKYFKNSSDNVTVKDGILKTKAFNCDTNKDNTDVLNEIKEVIEPFIEGLGTNLGKRLALLTAQGRRLSESNNTDQSSKKYIQLVMNDNISPTNNILSIIEFNKPDGEKITKKDRDLVNNVFSEDEEKREKAVDELSKLYPQIADFLTNTATDAQEYTTAKEHIDILFGQGRLDDDVYKSVSKKLKKQSEAEEKGKPIPQDAYLTKDEIGKVLQPLKPVYTGMTDVNGILRPVYVKSSSYPLIPQQTQGFELDKLRRYMEEVQRKTGKNVRAAYTSAVKVGSPVRVLDIWDKNGNFNDSLLANIGNDSFVDTYKDAHIELDRDNFKIQLDVPVKDKDYISLGTQLDKLLFGDGVLDIENGFMFKGENLSGKAIREIYKKTFRDLLEVKKAQLLNEWNITPDGIMKNPNETLNALKKVLIEEAQSKGASEADIKFIEHNLQYQINNGSLNFTNTSLSIHNSSESFESLLMSYISKRIYSIKLPGYSFVTASETGYKTLKKTDTSGVSKYKNRIVFTDKWEGELKATMLEDGKIKQAQVLMPSKFKDNEGNEIKFFNEDGTSNSTYVEYNDEKGIYTLKEGMIDEEILQRVSFRIPTSSLISSSAIEIVGFLPEEAGDIIVVPKALVTQKGLDFDVDKENTYGLYTMVDKDGKIKAYHATKEGKTGRESLSNHNVLGSRLNQVVLSKNREVYTSSIFMPNGYSVIGDVLAKAFYGKEIRDISIQYSSDDQFRDNIDDVINTISSAVENDNYVPDIDTELFNDLYSELPSELREFIIDYDQNEYHTLPDSLKDRFVKELFPEASKKLKEILKQEKYAEIRERLEFNPILSIPSNGLGFILSATTVLSSPNKAVRSTNTLDYNKAKNYLNVLELPETNVDNSLRLNGNVIVYKGKGLKDRTKFNANAVNYITIDSIRKILSDFPSMDNNKMLEYLSGGSIELSEEDITALKGYLKNKFKLNIPFLTKSGDVFYSDMKDKSNSPKYSTTKIANNIYNLISDGVSVFNSLDSDIRNSLFNHDSNLKSKQVLANVNISAGEEASNGKSRTVSLTSVINNIKGKNNEMRDLKVNSNANLFSGRIISDNAEAAQLYRNTFGENFSLTDSKYKRNYNKRIQAVNTVLNSDAIYLIDNISPSGNSTENTAELKQVAVKANKPLFVFMKSSKLEHNSDDEHGKWYYYDYNTDKFRVYVNPSSSKKGVPPLSNKPGIVASRDSMAGENGNIDDKSEDLSNKSNASTIIHSLINNSLKDNSIALQPVIRSRASSFESVRKNELDSLEKMLKNDLVRITKSVLQNPDRRIQKKMASVLSMDFAKSQVKLLNSEKKNKFFDITNTEYQQHKVTLGASGRMAIGVYSNGVVQLALLQQFREVYKDSKEYNNGKLTLTTFGEQGERVPLMLNLGGQVFNAEKNSYGSQVKTLDGNRTIAEVLAERQNTATDNEKEQILGNLNINKHTIGVDTLLTLMGYDQIKLLDKDGKENTYSIPYLIMKSPLMVALVKEADDLNVDINQYLRDKYFSDSSLIKEDLDRISLDSNLDLQVLLDSYNTEAKTSDEMLRNYSSVYTMTNLHLLKIFYNLTNISSDFLKANKLINSSSYKLGNSIAEANERYRMMEDGIPNDISKRIIGLDKFLKSDMLTSDYMENAKPMFDIVKRLMGVDNIMFPDGVKINKSELDSDYLLTQQRILRNYSVSKHVVDKLISQDRNDILDFIWSLDGSSNLTASIKKLKSIASNYTHLRNNRFLQALTVTSSAKVFTGEAIMIDNNMTDVNEVALIEMGLEELLADNFTVITTVNDKTVTVSDLAKTLIYYSYIFQNTATFGNIQRVIPSRYSLEILSDAKITTATDIDLAAYMAKFMPKHLKEFSGKDIDFYTDDKKVYKGLKSFTMTLKRQPEIGVIKMGDETYRLVIPIKKVEVDNKSGYYDFLVIDPSSLSLKTNFINQYADFRYERSFNKNNIKDPGSVTNINDLKTLAKELINKMNINKDKSSSPERIEQLSYMLDIVSRYMSDTNVLITKDIHQNYYNSSMNQIRMYNSYNNKTDNYDDNIGFIETFLHESTHAITLSVLVNNGITPNTSVTALREIVRKKNDKNNKIDKNVINLIESYLYALDNFSDKQKQQFQYALSSVLEFAAEATSNYNLQIALGNIKYKDSNIFQQIMRFIASSIKEIGRKLGINNIDETLLGKTLGEIFSIGALNLKYYENITPPVDISSLKLSNAEERYMQEQKVEMSKEYNKVNLADELIKENYPLSKSDIRSRITKSLKFRERQNGKSELYSGLNSLLDLGVNLKFYVPLGLKAQYSNVLRTITGFDYDVDTTKDGEIILFGKKNNDPKYKDASAEDLTMVINKDPNILFKEIDVSAIQSNKGAMGYISSITDTNKKIKGIFNDIKRNSCS